MVDETTFRQLKKALLEMMRGYPEYDYYGKLEFFLKTGKHAVNILHKHEVIEKLSVKEVKKRIEKMTTEELQKLPQGGARFRWYRLKPRGVDMAISMINLEHSERVAKYTKTIKTLTWIIGGITLLNLIFIIFSSLS